MFRNRSVISASINHLWGIRKLPLTQEKYIQQKHRINRGDCHNIKTAGSRRFVGSRCCDICTFYGAADLYWSAWNAWPAALIVMMCSPASRIHLYAARYAGSIRILPFIKRDIISAKCHANLAITLCHYVCIISCVANCFGIYLSSANE